MKRDFWDRFASKLKSLEEAPEPLRGAVAAAIKSEDAVRLLVFGPAYKGGGQRLPASLLAVLDAEWVLATGTDTTEPTVARARFADTLLVEMTNILLYGKLRLDFAAHGRAQSVAIHFNTVMEGLFQEVVQRVLNGMDGVESVEPFDSRELYPALESLPLKFCNAVLEFIPMGQRVLDLVHWPAVLGRKLKILRHELAPEAMLALTERELLFISEEKTWSWIRPGRVQKYGSVVTHCPLSRIADIQLSEHDQLDTLDVEVRVRAGGEKLKIDFPREQKAKVSAFLEELMKQQTQRRGADRLAARE